MTIESRYIGVTQRTGAVVSRPEASNADKYVAEAIEKEMEAEKGNGWL